MPLSSETSPLSSQFRRSVEDFDEDIPELVARTCARAHEEASAYASVPRSAIKASIEMNVAVVRESLLSSQLVITDADVEALSRRVRDRHGQGLRVEDAIQGWRISIAVIHERFVEIATSRGVSATEMLLAARVLWQLGDVMAMRLTSLFHSQTLETALLDSHLRSEFLRDLFADQLPMSTIEARAKEFGLDPSVEYRTVKATPSGQCGSLESLRRQLEARSAGLVGLGDGHCFGLLTGVVDTHVTEGTVALGPAAPLHQIAASFAVAERIHEWMRRRHLQGVRRMEDIGWKLAVDQDAAVTNLLSARYRTPLAEIGKFGEEIWQSVGAYVGADRNVAKAASEQFIHQNTLRYRLARFTDLTGADLGSAAVLFEVSWVLAAEEADSIVAHNGVAG